MTSTDTLAMYDTPVLVDTRLAECREAIARLDAQIERAEAFIEQAETAEDYERDYPWFSQDKIDEQVAQRDLAVASRQAFIVEALQLQDKYTGWTRYYLVTNTGGHVHSSTSCSTCFPTTSYAWLTEQSGTTAEDLVALAGEKACTVCFPDAPVDVLRRKSRITYTTAEQRERAAERAEKRDAAERAKVVVFGYRGYGADRQGVKTFKSERAATNDIAGNLSSLCNYGTGHPSGPEWLNDIEVVRAALLAKGVDYDYDKALAAARKKYTAETRRFNRSVQAQQYGQASEEPNF